MSRLRTAALVGNPNCGKSALFNVLTGEVIFGGVGAGLYGMLMFTVLVVFIAGRGSARRVDTLARVVGLDPADKIKGAKVFAVYGITAMGTHGSAPLGYPEEDEAVAVLLEHAAPLPAHSFSPSTRMTEDTSRTLARPCRVATVRRS